LGCRLLQRTDRRSWLASAQPGCTEKASALMRAGITILPCSLDHLGRIDLFSLMDLLRDRGINSLMVEGGARVITSFIRAGLVDLFVITVSPSMIGGLQVVDGNGASPLHRLPMTEIHYERLDDDMIIWARPHWKEP
jgi:diaminohydroxyphosphoribosylaminopyrimidine deaminase/5-amino-6-(5-phosphoribosylamino)uracil reductase